MLSVSTALADGGEIVHGVGARDGLVTGCGCMDESQRSYVP